MKTANLHPTGGPHLTTPKADTASQARRQTFPPAKRVFRERALLPQSVHKQLTIN